MKPSSQQSLVALLLFCLIGVALSRVPWMGRDIWNLDEGSTFTMAHQVLDGGVLYRDAADNRSPLVPYLKALIFAVFGEWNAGAIHLALAVLIGLTTFGLGWIGLRLGGWSLAWPTVISAWFLQIFWIDVGDAMSANTEWFVIAFSTAAFALFVASVEKPSLGRGLGVGLLFGGAVLCKQPGLLDMLVAAVLLGLLALNPGTVGRRELLRFGAAMVVGTLVPLALFSIHYAMVGAWADYVFYAFTLNTEIYIPEVPFWERLAGVRLPFVMAWHNAPLFGLLGIIAAGGLLIRALPQLGRKSPIELLPWLILGWTASGLVGTMLSGREFAHYSEQIIPGLSLAVGWLFQRLRSGRTAPWLQRGRYLQGLLVVALVASIAVRSFQIRAEVARTDDRPHPLGELARQFSDPDERLLVWGYFPEIYFVAQRLPSTRYIYTNYLTGLIAWTNLDPFLDVAKGISPGAQEKFEADFTARPPAVIVDTNDLRGYARFPIEDRKWLWPRITRDYAQVAAYSVDQTRMRLFRRLDKAPPGVEQLPRYAELSSALEISGYADLRPGSQPTLEIKGGLAINRLILMSDDHVRASLPHDPESPVQVRFFGGDLPLDLPRAWALGQRTDGSWIRSERFNFSHFLRQHRLTQPMEPALTFEASLIPPSVVTSQYPKINAYNEEGNLWSLQAPAQLRYPCPEGVRRLRFVHSISLAAMFKSDGYDISIYWLTPDGQESLLWRRRMEPHRRGQDQFPQNEEIMLPTRSPGELEFRFTSGAKSDAENDQIYFGELAGFTIGPTLYVGDDAVLAASAEETPYIDNDAGHWLLHAPAQVVWPRPANLMELTFDYGVEVGAYEFGDQGHTTGVGFQVTLQTESGQETRLWRDILRPFVHPEDRGVQTARIALPPNGTGKLILTTDGGDDDDYSWDWSFAGNFNGITTGPTITLTAGAPLLSIRNHGYNEGWSDRQSADRWGAQTPQELVYRKPARMTELTLRFGINPEAARDEHGLRRSDGVHVRVIFQSNEGDEIELFERFLDPFNRPEDAGEHSATFKTEPGREGTLHVHMEAGPRGDSAYDWAFWGQFEGKIDP